MNKVFKISLNELDNLIEVLKTEKHIVKIYDLSDYDDVWEKLENITKKQKDYMLALMFNPSPDSKNKLIEVLEKLKFNKK